MTTHHDEQLIVHNREMHLDVFTPLAVGDTFDAIRGNGQREGDHMGSTTVTGFEDDGSPILSVAFDGSAFAG